MMNLKEIRKERGMTQQQLADSCGMKNTRIANYEAGIREPRLQDAQKIAVVLNCTLDELIGEPKQEPSCSR